MKKLDSEFVFSNRLKEFRLEKNLTQSQLAFMVDVSKNTISNIETGCSIPSCFLALKIAYALDIDLERIFRCI